VKPLPPDRWRTFGATAAGILLVGVAIAWSVRSPTLLAFVAFSVGFGWLVCRTPHWKTLPGTVAAGGTVGGVAVGIPLGLDARLDGVGALQCLAIILASPLIGVLFAPLGTIMVSPILVAAARSRRGNAHDGAATVLAVGGAWTAIVTCVVASFVHDAFVMIVAGLGVVAYVAGRWGRSHVAREIAGVRSGLVPGLTVVAREDIHGAVVWDAIPPAQLGTCRSGEQLAIVARFDNVDYRAVRDDVVIARFEKATRTSLVHAAFSGPVASGADLALLGMWAALNLGVVAYLYLALMSLADW
jgi:hypothetical protein